MVSTRLSRAIGLAVGVPMLTLGAGASVRAMPAASPDPSALHAQGVRHAAASQARGRAHQVTVQQQAAVAAEAGAGNSATSTTRAQQAQSAQRPALSGPRPAPPDPHGPVSRFPGGPNL